MPLEVPSRDAPKQELASGFFGLVAFDSDDVLLGGDRNLVGREAGNRKGDLVPVVGQPLDVRPSLSTRRNGIDGPDA